MKTRQSEPNPALERDSRMSLDDTFCFDCGPHVPCFTECCGKLELRITPYDALRLRRRLGISAEEFLDSHTIIRWRTDHGLPEVMMKMDPAAGKKCPFVTSDGCSVYEDRPGACRIYPVGRASTRDPVDGSPLEFFFTVKEDHCRGFEQTRRWSVREWVEDQGLEEYNQVNDLLMELYVLKAKRPKLELLEQHKQMFLMTLYNSDKFRDFILKSPFLTKFEVEPELLHALTDDDLELLLFGFRWLRFALFQQPVLKMKK
ncbi:YkgJ family cysteine cluster protein [Thermodesulfobacteriota bacterium]